MKDSNEKNMPKKSVKAEKQLFESIYQLILTNREPVVRMVNQKLTMLYRNIGKQMKALLPSIPNLN